MINKKFVITGVSVFVVIVIAAIVAIFVFADPWVENKINNRLKGLESESLTISYKNLDVDLLSGSMTLESGSLEQHTKGQNNFQVTVKTLSISGFDIISYIFNNKIVLDQLELDSPHIKYYMIAESDTVATDQQRTALPKIMIKLLQLKNGTFSIAEVNDSVSSRVAEGNFKVVANNLVTDSTTSHPYGYFDLESLDIDAGNINYLMTDSLHNMHIKSISYSLTEEAVKIDSIHIQSLYEKYQLAHVAGHELDWMNIYNPSVEVTGISLASIVNGFYDVDRITIEGLDALLFRDKRLPYPDKPDSKLLHEIMADMTSLINIDTIELKKAKIEYQEHIEQSGEPGNIFFSDLYATFYNLTNVDSIASKINNTAHMDAQCYVMGKSMLKTSFSFPLIASEQPYTVSGALKEMDLTAINPMLERVAFVRIETGHLVDLNFDFSYNTERSNGKMAFAYENLKIRTQDKETNKGKGTGEGIKSFIANVLILKNNNLRSKDDFRVGDIEFTRNKKKSVFNYWWKSLLTGFRSSTGLSAPKRTEEKD